MHEYAHIPLHRISNIETTCTLLNACHWCVPAGGSLLCAQASAPHITAFLRDECELHCLCMGHTLSITHICAYTRAHTHTHTQTLTTNNTLILAQGIRYPLMRPVTPNSRISRKQAARKVAEERAPWWSMVILITVVVSPHPPLCPSKFEKACVAEAFVHCHAGILLLLGLFLIMCGSCSPEMYIIFYGIIVNWHQLTFLLIECKTFNCCVCSTTWPLFIYNKGSAVLHSLYILFLFDFTDASLYLWLRILLLGGFPRLTSSLKDLPLPAPFFLWGVLVLLCCQNINYVCINIYTTRSLTCHRTFVQNHFIIFSLLSAKIHVPPLVLADENVKIKKIASKIAAGSPLVAEANFQATQLCQSCIRKRKRWL
jgi:hypothetical protein